MIPLIEAQKFLQKNVQCPGLDQWCAIKEEDGTRDWVQVGDLYHFPGKSVREAYKCYPDWGEDINVCDEGLCIWTFYVLYKIKPLDLNDISMT